MKLTWDETKRALNLAKHGIDFVVADGFDWAGAVLVEDTRKDYGETRFVAIGGVAGTLYSLVFTRRPGEVRLISLRKASRKERKFHEQKTPHH